MNSKRDLGINFGEDVDRKINGYVADLERREYFKNMVMNELVEVVENREVYYNYFSQERIRYENGYGELNWSRLYGNCLIIHYKDIVLNGKKYEVNESINTECDVNYNCKVEIVKSRMLSMYNFCLDSDSD